MSRAAQFVLLCEDTQHEAFVRRFLAKRGITGRRLRVLKNPGQGAADAWVRNRFPTELAAIRKRPVETRLVVVIDGDRFGVSDRRKELDERCRATEVEPVEITDPVALIVPTWNIETWLAYLDGEAVDETKSDYPRLKRERECQQHVDALHRMCQNRSLREPPPRSLRSACDELERLMGS